MTAFSRREALLALPAGGLAAAGSTSYAAGLPKPQSSRTRSDDPGPRNLDRDIQNPDILNHRLPMLNFAKSTGFVCRCATKQHAAGWNGNVCKGTRNLQSIAGVDMRRSS